MSNNKIKFNKLSVDNYVDYLSGSIYKILPIYDESDYIIYKRYISDLIDELFAFDEICNSNYFVKLILNLECLKDPKIIGEEDEKKYVRRKVFKCVNIGTKIAEDIKKGDFKNE